MGYKKMDQSLGFADLALETCNLCKVNPFEYLKTLQQHSSKLFQNPNQWIHWNYEKTISPVTE